MSVLTKVEINDVDVTSYLASYVYERTYGDMISEISLVFNKNINDAVTLTNGQTIEVWRGFVTSTDKKIFWGYIEKFEPQGGIVKITGLDKLWDLVRKEINHTYDSSVDASAGKISEIFEDIVETYGGLTCDVQDSGTTYTLQKFICNHADLFERCKKLADILDWQFYYDADTDTVYFEPKGYTLNSSTLTVGTNVLQVPTWNYDVTEMANDITIVGAYQEIETTETGRIGTTSGYATTGIDLSFVPISVKVYGDAANPPTTLKTGGMPDSTSTYDYYVDKVLKKIIPITATPFVTNDYYEIRYSFATPIPVHMYNQASIDTYGTFKKTITYTDIRTVSDAENRGTNYLAKYSTPFIYTTLKVKSVSTITLEVGENINVIDTISSPVVSSVLLINKLRIRYPGDYDEVEVGDKYWRLAEYTGVIMEKLKRLEEAQLENQDISYEIVSVDNTQDYPITVRKRYSSIYTQTVSGTDVFILGHATYGILGTGVLGDTDFGAETLYWLEQGDNEYIENFYDTDFKG